MGPFVLQASNPPTMIIHIAIRIQTFIAVIASAALVACSGQPETSEEQAVHHLDQEQEAEALRVQEAEEKAYLELLTPDPPVNLCELTAIDDEFDKRIFRNATGTLKLKRPTYKFTAASLRHLLESSTCQAANSTVLVIRYGLDSNMELTYGLGLSCAAFGGDRTFPDPTDYYTVDNKVLVRWDPAAHGGKTWVQEFGDRYTEHSTAHNVYIERKLGDNTNYPYDPVVDTRYMTHTVDRVLSFLQDNEHSETGKQLTDVELVSYCELRTADIYHHGVALLGWAGNDRMLDGLQHANDFDMRAANLGSPCPENCNLLKVPVVGHSVPGC